MEPRSHCTTPHPPLSCLGEEVPGPEGQSDDFSEDVLSSARKSLVRNTPHSVMHKGQRRAVQSSEELSDGEDVVSKLQLDSDADQSD